MLGLGTKWGLVRYWWVAIKLALNAALVALVAFALRPGVTELAEQADGSWQARPPRSRRGSAAAPEKDDGTSDGGAKRDAYPSRDNGKEESL